jgi:hypothetical protein
MFPIRKSRRRRICRKEPAASCLKPDRLIVSPTDKLDEAEKSSNKYQTAKNMGEREDVAGGTRDLVNYSSPPSPTASPHLGRIFSDSLG